MHDTTRVVTRAARAYVVACAMATIADGALVGRLPAQTQNRLPPTTRIWRRVTVADAVAVTRLIPPSDAGAIVVVSPDGQRFAILARRADLHAGVNVYRLIAYRTATAFSAPVPDTLVTRTSASNADAIAQVRWTADGQRLAFLGRDERDSAQVFVVDLTSRRVTQGTHVLESVASYDMSASGETVIAIRNTAADSLPNLAAAESVLVESTPVLTLTKYVPAVFPSQPNWNEGAAPYDLRVVEPAGGVRLLAHVRSYGSPPTLRLSPSGSRLVTCETGTDRDLSQWADTYPGGDLHVTVTNRVACAYVVYDLRSGVRRRILEAPAPNGVFDALWLANDSSLVLHTALPSGGVDSAEVVRRRTTPVIAAVDVVPNRLQVILWCDGLHDGYTIVGFDRATRRLLLRDRYASPTKQLLLFRPAHTGWTRDTAIGTAIYSRLASVDRPYVHPESVVLHGDILYGMAEGGALAPELLAGNWRTGARRVVTDLNPTFRTLSFGRVDPVTWRDTSGREWRGGLVLPPDYVRGRRYPLVVQTHGYEPGEFLLDGPRGALFPAVFAAQPLAASGLIVLQMGGESKSGHGAETRSVAEVFQLGVERAIDSLDRQGLIDRTRVGLVGFSRTGWLVGYVATHSAYPIVAVTTADNVTYNYWEYIAFPDDSADGNSILGGPPWGATFATFRERSVDFNLNRATAAWRFEIHGDALGLIDDAFEVNVLRMMGKPAEFVWLPKSDHGGTRPQDRLVSMQGTVDWYQFWLMGVEDPDPAKTTQYARWRTMRAQREASLQKLPP